MFQDFFPVMFTFDLDAETNWISRDPGNFNKPGILSQGKFGAKVGVYRILELLNRKKIKSTFFIPGWVIEQYRSVVEEIHSEGHEIGHHGYMHEWPHMLSSDKEEEILKKGIDIIGSLTNQRPLGYRSPAWEFSKNTIQLLRKYNFLYSSNMMDDDKAYKHVVDGHTTNLIELPVQYILDDAPFFVWNFSMHGRTIRSVSEVYEIWAKEFEGMYRDKCCFVLSLHPQAIGRVSRIIMLEEFIDYIFEKRDVHFTTCYDTALKFKNNII